MAVDGQMDMDVDGNSYPSCLSSFIDEGSIESHRYFLSRRTVLEMLRDRGYLVPNSEIELSLADFRKNYSHEPDVDRLRISALHKDDPSNKVSCLVHSLSIWISRHWKIKNIVFGICFILFFL